MPMLNADIAAVFNEIADLLEIENENSFRIRAYRNGARTVSNFKTQFHTLLQKGGAIPKLPGIGKDLAAKIEEIISTGHCGTLDILHSHSSSALTELLKIPGIGPKRVQTLNQKLGIVTIEQLREAASAGKLRDLPHFGTKLEQHVLSAIGFRIDATKRLLRPLVEQYAKAISSYLSQIEGVEKITVAGSYRRLKDTVGDIDILITGQFSNSIMKNFIAYEDVKTVLAHGTKRSSVILNSGIQVDLRFVQPESYGAALCYFTGSKSHNIAMRRLAKNHGIKLNEYGVFKNGTRIAGTTEESVFEAVGLPYIAPELRENRGEIELARIGKLPDLVSRKDIQGDLHIHTLASDGKNSIAEMARGSAAQGLQYIAITDHSAHLSVAHGLTTEMLVEQIKEIDDFNARSPGITVLKGIEVDILSDGALDLPDTILGKLDIVIAAVHSKFDLPRAQQTERILHALNHPLVNMLAHPTGRLIGSREPCNVDMLRIISTAKSKNVALEINSQPERLDLDDIHCKMARDEGVLLSINSDAHNVEDLSCLRYGIDQARRGWLEPGQVLNTRDLEAFRSWLNNYM